MSDAARPVDLRRRVYLVVLQAFRRLPAPVRRALVRAGTPGYTVGAVCLLERDGRLLMLRQPHRAGWSLPGGLLDRGEPAATAVARELREELGLRVVVGSPVTVVVDAPLRRVDVVYRIAVDGDVGERPGGEAVQARWLSPVELGPDDADAPTLQILAAAAAVADAAGYAGRVL